MNDRYAHVAKFYALRIAFVTAPLGPWGETGTVGCAS